VPVLETVAAGNPEPARAAMREHYRFALDPAYAELHTIPFRDFPRARERVTGGRRRAAAPAWSEAGASKGGCVVVQHRCGSLRRTGLRRHPRPPRPDEVDGLQEAFDRLPAGPPSASGIVKHNERTLLEDERFFAAITKPDLLSVVSATLGDDLQLLALDTLETPPHQGRERSWHADMEFWSDAVLTANVAIYLQDMTDAAGPLLVLPGSHRRRRAPTPAEEGVPLEGEVPVPVRADGAVVFNAQLWHSGGPNDTDRPRRAIFPYFGHYWIKRMDEFYRRPLPSTSSSTTIRSSASCSGWGSPSRSSTAAMTR
jgi:hypothetical protein